jgi:hypothetical protein
MVILQAVSRTFNGVDLQANVDNSMPTLFEFAEQQHLHSKQLIAFQVIYSSVMLSILCKYTNRNLFNVQQCIRVLLKKTVEENNFLCV